MRLNFDWSRLRRGSVSRAAATYLVTSWLVLEVGHILSLILEVPHAAMKVVFWALVVGFPIAIVLAWRSGAAGPDLKLDLPETEPASGAEHRIHEAQAEESGGGHGGHAGAGHGGGGATDPLPFIVGGMVLLAIVFLAVGHFMPGAGREEAAEGSRTAATTTTAASSAAATAPANSVAVLRFENLSGDPKRDYFSDGLSEELLDALAQIPSLKVAARTSSFAFRPGEADSATIGRKLGVHHILDGTVRQDGDMLRVSAELGDTRTGYRTWSQTYDRRLTDVFKVQHDIATAVAEALRVQLGAGQTLILGGTDNPAAYDAYLQGRRLLDLSGDEAQWREALKDFDRAIALDPGYSAAQAARARALVGIANAFTPAAQLPAVHAAALAAAQEAARLAPTLPEAQSTLGYVWWQAKLDAAAAAGPFEKSVQLAPGSAEILSRYGLFATRTGRVDAGVRALETATNLDPLNPTAYKTLGRGLYAVRRWPDAIAAFRHALALSPAMTYAHASIGDGLLALGDAKGAAAEYAQEPIGWAKLTGLALVAARTGQAAEAHRGLDQLVRTSGDSNLYQQAEIEAQLGDRAKAVDALYRARQVGDVGLTSLASDPWLDPLRGDPRFKALAVQLGFR
jgi:TolB-like protein/Tfp pilus assembly protein PilF